MNITRLLIIHALITFIAGVVLFVAPSFIPNMVGINLDTNTYLLSYLLAGAEFSMAFLSYYGKNLRDAHSLRLIVQTIILFHGSTAFLEMYATALGSDARLWFNVVFRAVIVFLFAYYGLYKLPVKQDKNYLSKIRRNP